MELKEGIDYHIKDIGKTKEVSSVTLSGYTAGIKDITRRGYDINLAAVITIGSMMVATTLPKKPAAKKKPAKKK